MLISVAEYESMRETLDLLSDTEALADLRQSREDFALATRSRWTSSRRVGGVEASGLCCGRQTGGWPHQRAAQPICGDVLPTSSP